MKLGLSLTVVDIKVGGDKQRTSMFCAPLLRGFQCSVYSRLLSGPNDYHCGWGRNVERLLDYIFCAI